MENIIINEDNINEYYAEEYLLLALNELVYNPLVIVDNGRKYFIVTTGINKYAYCTETDDGYGFCSWELNRNDDIVLINTKGNTYTINRKDKYVSKINHATNKKDGIVLTNDDDNNALHYVQEYNKDVLDFVYIVKSIDNLLNHLDYINKRMPDMVLKKELLFIKRYIYNNAYRKYQRFLSMPTKNRMFVLDRYIYDLKSILPSIEYNSIIPNDLLKIAKGDCEEVKKLQLITDNYKKIIEK